MHAQRERVLKQIDVPHDYYFREMYLPQASSGPSSVAWSPDGLDVVFSQQGFLWRHRLGSKSAEQLTSDSGYDYQPDWSPDGRSIVYVSYQRDAMDLRLLDLRTGVSSALLANGAVHLEPRWSPDGSRLVFVSTMFEGRWHVFTATVNNGALEGIERVTEDRDSGLPRYYYSRFDHYLSPTWSPDGRAIALVSNRDRIWGTGGFWRMNAAAGAPMQSIHDEETTWKARPDWSRDGRRIVYSSYHGRQWQQLWLMTGTGGEVIPLTFGDFDATAPRWSPDGRRIAYVSNEGGNTSLWTLDIPGGHRQKVDVSDYRYRVPIGRLEISVLDDATNRPVAARISVIDSGGRGYAPDGAWRQADDSFDRGERRFEYSYFHALGTATLTVPAGSLTVEVFRGLQYEPKRLPVLVSEGARRTVTVRFPARLADLQSAGWHSGDLHVHMNYGGAYRNDPTHLAFQAAAEDLEVVENLIVNKEQRFPDMAFFSPKPDPASTRTRLIQHGQEFHTSSWGHLALLGLRDHLLLPGFAGYMNTGAASLFPHNAAILDLAHEQGAIAGYVHPFVADPDPTRADGSVTSELPVDVALGKVDYLEVVGFSDHLATARVWYRLLNCGFRIPAGAGTDAMANYASLRGPLGLNRVFVKTGPVLDHEAWLNGIRAGRTFATNGPLLQFTLAGRDIGDEIRLPRGRHELQALGRLRSIVPVDHLEIVRNGEVVATVPLSGDRRNAVIDLTVQVDQSGWYTLRAWNDRATHPILDVYPFATTSPIYVTVGDKPIRSPGDADYFLAWIDRLNEAVQAHSDWNTADEKGAVMGSIEAARAIFRERRSGTSR